MKLEKLVGERFKEKPADCVIDSHAFMIRGGYMKYVANGIYSQYPPLVRVTRKISQIIREEMDKLDGQEVLFPVVLPGDLWRESGRYDSIGSELMRMKDRNGSDLVLGMTHEEAAVQLVREYGKSYSKYPFMIYQIQTKFRDEARPRAGLIRVREFTMKDAYSFHTSQEDLNQYYARFLKAYHRIYERAGIPEVIDVASDSGMMGGSVSHEYMLLTPVGEDSIAVCTECDYRSNVESAVCMTQKVEHQDEAKAEMIATPGQETIEAVCHFLNAEQTDSCKAVVYQNAETLEYIVVFLRGDLEVNETKLRNQVGADIIPAEIQPGYGLVPGYIGPYALELTGKVFYDNSLKGRQGIVAGANQEGYHYHHISMERDVPQAVYGDYAKIKEGSICPKCGKKTIKISRGIEVGNIFQLGTKYTKAMNMQYLDENGELQYPVMGCYGIGVGRLAASVCEAHHDEYGPIWPMSIAPWQVHLCCIRSDVEEARTFADQLYRQLEDKGIEVIYDDRQVRPGVMFSDADLLGVPVRIIVSPKNMEAGICEVKTRDKSIDEKVPLTSLMDRIDQLLR